MSGIQCFFKSPRNQLFAFPPDMISSMLENPSSHKGLLKLYQTCKYFWSKRQILIADDVRLKSKPDEDDDFEIWLFTCNNALSLTSLTIPIWLSNTIMIKLFYETQLPKFFRYSVKHIHLNCASLSFDDFILLTSEKLVTSFTMSHYSGSIYHDDVKASIDQILQHLPNIQYFDCVIEKSCTLEVLTRLSVMEFNNKFSELNMVFEEDIHSTFDFNIFCDFITKNCNSETILNVKCHITSLIEKLQPVLTQLDPKWKEEEVHQGLKKFFDSINPNWKQ